MGKIKLCKWMDCPRVGTIMWGLDLEHYQICGWPILCRYWNGCFYIHLCVNLYVRKCEKRLYWENMTLGDVKKWYRWKSRHGITICAGYIGGRFELRGWIQYPNWRRWFTAMKRMRIMTRWMTSKVGKANSDGSVLLLCIIYGKIYGKISWYLVYSKTTNDYRRRVMFRSVS